MPPLSVLLKPASSLCNMRCGYCFYADVADHRTDFSHGMMSEDTLEVLTEKALAYADGQCAFLFQGGEPTLAGLSFYEKAIAFQQKYNRKRVAIRNAIQTNGLNLSREWAEFFAKHDFLAGVSVDGDSAIHNTLRLDGAGEGTYARVMDGIQRLKNAGCQYNILCVVTREVARHGARVYKALKKHGYLQFIPCVDGFDGEKSPYALAASEYGRFLDTIFDLYRRDYQSGAYVSERTFDNWIGMLLGAPPESCAMAGRCTANLVVEGDGSVYPCDFYVLDEWRLGNILTDDVDGMLSSDAAKAFVERALNVAEECGPCRWRPLCRGGCRRDRETHLGAPLERNRFCEAYQGFFEKNIQRLEEIARMEAGGRRP